MAEEVRAGDGTVIRLATTAALAEVRTLLEVAVRLRSRSAWDTFTSVAGGYHAELRTALPTLYDPSDREEAAYADGQRRAYETLDAWVSDQQGMHRDTIPATELRARIARELLP